MPEFKEVRIVDGSAVITGIERRGAGTPIVLLHGVGGNALWFQPMMSALCASRVIALDMPGHGGSTDAPSWEMDSLAESVFALSRHLVNGPVIWGGHSWGGKLAAMIAAIHPETAAALLLLDPTPPSGMPVPVEWYVNHTFAGELGPWPSLEEARTSVRNLPQYVNWNGDLARAFERGLVRGVDGMLRARISRQTLIEICATALADHSATIRKVSCPTLFVVADESLGFHEPLSFALLPHAVRAVIRSNHWLMASNPAELNRAVESWLAKGDDCAHEAGTSPARWH
ncbi:MAG: alpha/beta hydrolase [Candidatus Binatus sp.]